MHEDLEGISSCPFNIDPPPPPDDKTQFVYMCEKIHLNDVKCASENKKIIMIVTRNTENMVFIYEEHTFALGEKKSGNTKPV